MPSGALETDEVLPKMLQSKVPILCEASCPRAFPIKASNHTEVIGTAARRSPRPESSAAWIFIGFVYSSQFQVLHTRSCDSARGAIIFGTT